jgi:hypothetical protein
MSTGCGWVSFLDGEGAILSMLACNDISAQRNKMFGKEHNSVGLQF